MKHTHEFKRSKPTSTVDICYCGQFRHNENNKNPVIVEIPVSKHTPTPWTFGDMGEEKPGYYWISGPCGNLGHIVGDREFNGVSNAKDNAELIVRAMNSHEALLEALKYVQQFYQEYFDSMPVAFQSVDDFVGNAIAKAEGVDK